MQHKYQLLLSLKLSLIRLVTVRINRLLLAEPNSKLAKLLVQSFSPVITFPSYFPKMSSHYLQFYQSIFNFHRSMCPIFCLAWIDIPQTPKCTALASLLILDWHFMNIRHKIELKVSNSDQINLTTNQISRQVITIVIGLHLTTYDVNSILLPIRDINSPS